MKIGILGGSFDPFHKAHLQMGLNALKELPIDELWFLVSNNTPLKKRELSNFDMRCKIINKKINPYKKMKICDIEKDSKGVNYTIDTMRKLIKKYPNDEFTFIIGGDQAANINKWKDIDELKKIVNIAYYDREGYTVKDKTLIKLQMPLLNISSTDIRNGKLSMLASSSIEYIMDNHEVLLNFMSEYRYNHSLEVAKMAKDLALKNNLDPKKAYIAGLLHDINKEFKVYSIEESKLILEGLNQETLLNKNEGCWHGYVGAFYVKHVLKIYDDDICEAIRRHVLGESKNKYAIIIYLADKLEMTRDYPKVEEYRKLAYEDIYKAHKLLVDINSKRYEEN